MMRKVILEIKLGKYTILKLDGPIPSRNHTKYLIDEREFAIVPIYDAPNCIAVEFIDGFSFEDKEVELK